MKALLLIDIQNDFCKGGALEVPDGNAVVPIANALMPLFPVVVATQDWHPADHKSFAANHPGLLRPGQVIRLNGLQQVLWPIHCVQNSMGAELVADLEQNGITKIFYKGTDTEIDSYSGFFDNGKLKSTGLANYLQEKGVTEVYVMGLATDYCVQYTVLDALELGFNTFVIEDGCRGVDLQKGDCQKALETMTNKGAMRLESKKLIRNIV